MLMLALLAAAQTAPAPGPIKVFGDWAVACDNARRCEMTSLIPGDDVTQPASGYDSFWLSIERLPGPAGGFTVEVSLNIPLKGELTLVADGKIVASGPARGDGIVFTGADAGRIVAAIANAKELALAEGEGATDGQLSLAGSSAALRFIDAEQGRAGGVTAAVAKGAKPASAVPAAAPLPKIRSVRAGGTAAAIAPALKAKLFAESDCGGNYEANDLPDIETHAIGGGTTLALVPCGAGAYNFSSVPYLIRGGRTELAKFDFAPGMTAVEDGTPTLVNAQFDAKTGQLSSYSKGRGLGDCGGAEDYVWDEATFRLVEARSMTECRGSVNWLAVWRAEAVAQ